MALAESMLVAERFRAEAGTVSKGELVLVKLVIENDRVEARNISRTEVFGDQLLAEMDFFVANNERGEMKGFWPADKDKFRSSCAERN